MSKRFKLKLFRAIPTFRFCRSKRSDSSFPRSPVRLCYGYKPSPVNQKARDLAYPANYFPPPNTPQDTTPLHTFVKYNGGGGGGYKSGESKRQLLSPDDYTWSKEPKWLTVGKVEDCEDRKCRQMFSPVSSGDIDDDGFSGNRKFLKKKRSRKKRSGVTSTAASSGGDSGWFTSEETDAFLSPSKESSHRVGTRKSGKPKQRWNSYKTVTSTGIKPPKPKSRLPPRMTLLGRMAMMKCDAEGKVKESFAVVKKSEDPYEDFKTSMLEMILEKQMFDAKELEELLRCFLALNLREHHRIIVEAFTEIWEILFCKCHLKQI